jgi:hypothetical protein
MREMGDILVDVDGSEFVKSGSIRHVILEMECAARNDVQGCKVASKTAPPRYG